MFLTGHLISLGGGVLIGVAGATLWVFQGRVFGVSGILRGALSSITVGDTKWRLAALLGLFFGGLVFALTSTPVFDAGIERPIWSAILGGVLVGVGTQVGSGCTSGHGICGISRLSPRSIVATLIFVGTGMATATVVGSIGGVP